MTGSVQCNEYRLRIHVLNSECLGSKIFQISIFLDIGETHANINFSEILNLGNLDESQLVS